MLKVMGLTQHAICLYAQLHSLLLDGTSMLFLVSPLCDVIDTKYKLLKAGEILNAFLPRRDPRYNIFPLKPPAKITIIIEEMFTS